MLGVLAAAVFAALRGVRRLDRILLRMKIELLLVPGATEVTRLPVVLSMTGGGGRVDVHPAHGIFHSGCGLHCQGPSCA